ncbi:hypothetical protein [Streptomyces sp. NPDC055912]|uniref:hypothetical protein n=1 Tax=Streptomyces sp. NPDC055912 TaxID=3345660 RepID=UPI0035E3887E
MPTDTLTPVPAPALAQGPGLDAHPADEAWRAALDVLADLLPEGTVAVDRGWHLDWERARFDEAVAAGRAHLSVRLLGDEVLVGPLWRPGTGGGWAGWGGGR